MTFIRQKAWDKVLPLLFVYAAASPPEYGRPRSALIVNLPCAVEGMSFRADVTSSASAQRAAAGAPRPATAPLM